MYKVFFNDHSLVFSGKSQNLLKDNNYQIIEIEEISEFEARFPNGSFMKLVDNLHVVTQQPDQLWHQFRKNRHQIPAAGGVVVNEKDELLFIKRFGRWDLPKGKIEQGESIEQAAIREVEEESGLTNLKLKKQLPSSFHLYHSSYLAPEDNLVLKETSWFEMQYLGGQVPRPQQEEHIEEVKWFTKDKLGEVLASTYKNLEELLNHYLS